MVFNFKKGPVEARFHSRFFSFGVILHLNVPFDYLVISRKAITVLFKLNF